MTGRTLLLGIDGGNTKTVAVVAEPDGAIRGVARVLRRSDIYAVPAEVALAIYHEAANEALRMAGASDEDRIVAGFSLAGADWPEDHHLLEGLMHARWPGAPVVNDAIGGLRAAIPSGPGVVIVCGTGAATGARGPDGRTWHTSFWQEPQGAHELGLRALRAIYRAELGIEGPTALTERVLAETGEPSVEALLHHASARSVVDRRDPASLAWILLEVAESGDPAAVAIVQDQGAELGRTALAAARRVGIAAGDPFALALAGGVLRQPASALRDAIVETVQAGATGVVILGPALEPAAGALLLAFDTAGIVADAAVLDRIRAGIDSSGVFDTHPLRRHAG